MWVKFRIEQIVEFQKYEWVRVHGEGAFFEIKAKLEDIEFMDGKEGPKVRRCLPKDLEE